MKRIILLIITLFITNHVFCQTQTCYNCNGSGRIICSMCGGSGGTYTMFGPAPCFGCGGYGSLSCYMCGGAGIITVSNPTPTYPSDTPISTPTYDDAGSSSSTGTCRACNGSGKCRRCNGTGKVYDYGSSSLTTKEKYEYTCKVCGGSGRCGGCN